MCCCCCHLCAAETADISDRRTVMTLKNLKNIAAKRVFSDERTFTTWLINLRWTNYKKKVGGVC